MTGLLSAAGTSAVGLIVSHTFRPLFLVRYLYPLTAVVYLVFGFLLSKVRWRTILSSILILGTLVCSLPDFYQTYQREKRIDLATTQCLEVITPTQDAVLYTTNYFLDWTLFDYYFPGRVHAQIESSNTSQCFTFSDPEIWLFMEHALSDAELNAPPTMVILTPMSATVHLQKAPVKIPFITSTNFKNPQTPPRNYPHPLSLTRRLCICYTFCTIPG